MQRTHLILLGLCATVLSAPAKPEAAAKPNIIVIVTDDLGYGDLSCYGATRIHTPNVDHLAAEGMRFTEAYAPASTCTPSRYSLLTGDYAWRQTAKKTTILDGDAPLAIEPGSLTLPEMLRRAGYATGIIGKWHLGLGDGITPVNFNGDIKPGPREVGFDYSCIIPATVDRVPCVWIENHRVVGLDINDPISVSYLKNISDDPTGLEHPELLKQPADKQHSGTIVDGISRIGYMKGGHSARWKDGELAQTLVDKTVAFIKEHKNQPFFAYVGMFEPHVPRTAEPPFAGKSECGLRGDVIEQIDWETAQIMDALKRFDLMTNTLVLFTSDNGPIFFDGYYDHSRQDANGHQPAGGLRGWKYLVYEGGTRVPFIAWWPGHVPAGVSDKMICLTDVIRTCATLTGEELPKNAAVDSLNQLPVLLNQKAKPVRTSVVEQGISGAFGIRQGDWKFIPANASAVASGMGSGANPNDPRFAAAIIHEPLLFNLAKDPDETNNVISRFPEKAKELAALLENERNGGISSSTLPAEVKKNPMAQLDKPEAIRGAIYVPAEAYNAPQMWKNFSVAETRRDFGYAGEIHLNALRVWASYEYWKQAPEKFQSSLDQMLAVADSHSIRILVSLFERCGMACPPGDMWSTNPLAAFAVISPNPEVFRPEHTNLWEEPRKFVTWFMNHYRNDKRLLAIEVMNEPQNKDGKVPPSMPFAKSMFATAKAMQGSVPLTIGSDTLAHAEEFIPLGLDVIEFHDNFPASCHDLETSIEAAVALGKRNHLPVWLTEWQRLRPNGTGWGNEKISPAETTPDYASLAATVQKYPVGNFFWSLMVKKAYLQAQRRKGTINGLFWPDGSVWSLADARAIADDPKLELPQKQMLPSGFLDYLQQNKP